MFVLLVLFDWPIPMLLYWK